MIIFRKADKSDAIAIANLHAESWRNTYRGIMSDAYLDNDIVTERQTSWQNRFVPPKENQHIILAIQDDKLAGFAAIYGADDPKWGTLIDNLHVRPDLKGQGIGKQLIQKAFDWAHQNYPKTSVYLWVFEENKASIAFYEAMGGTNVERELHHNEDGTEGYALRYAWV